MPEAEVYAIDDLRNGLSIPVKWAAVPGVPSMAWSRYPRSGVFRTRDNIIALRGAKLQNPSSHDRAHYMKARVRVHRNIDQSRAIFHGPECLARYSEESELTHSPTEIAAGEGEPRRRYDEIAHRSTSGQSIR